VTAISASSTSIFRKATLRLSRLEPRLKIQELQDNPERLDDQLFDISSAAYERVARLCRTSRLVRGLRAECFGLDAFFNLAARRYDLILIDLPATCSPGPTRLLRRRTASS